MGDKFYRFKFDNSGFVVVDVFEVVKLGFRGDSVKVECPEDKNRKYLQGVYFFPGNELGKVKTNGSSKYVLLKDDNVNEAATIVADYVRKKKDKAHGEYLKWSKQYDAMLDVLYNLTTCGDFEKR